MVAITQQSEHAGHAQRVELANMPSSVQTAQISVRDYDFSDAMVHEILRRSATPDDDLVDEDDIPT